MNDEQRSYDVVFDPGEGLQTRVPGQPAADQASYADVRIRAKKDEDWFIRKPRKGKKGKKKRPAAPKRPKKRPAKKR